MSRWIRVAYACAWLVVGCGGDDEGQRPIDGRVDDAANSDGGVDAAMDAATDDDAGPDASVDGSTDDAGRDAGPGDGPCEMRFATADLVTKWFIYLHIAEDHHLTDSRWFDPAASLGSFGLGLAAVADAVERADGNRFYGWIETLYDGQRLLNPSWTSGSYEELVLAAYGLLRAHEVTGELVYLEEASGIMTTVVASGMDDDVLWETTDEQNKSTVVNAMAAVVAARLHALTDEAALLTFARALYTRWHELVVMDDTHEARSGVNAVGAVSPRTSSLDQGLMIAASLALHHSTGEAELLSDAHELAEYLVNVLVTSSGILDDDECDARCSLGKGIAFRALMDLQTLDPRDRYAEVLEASADAALENAFLEAAPFDTLFGSDWASSSTVTGVWRIQDAISVVTALNAAARLETGCTFDAPSDVYEAEDAVNVGLYNEFRPAVYPGFTGYAVSNYWDNLTPNESITFRIRVPEEGAYVLAFRYAADRGMTATRRLLVDGTSLTEMLDFPAPPDVFDIREVPVELGAGDHEIMLISNHAADTGYLTLDSLTVMPLGSCALGDGALAAALDTPLRNDVVCGEMHEFCWTPPSGTLESRLYIDGTFVCSTTESCCEAEPGAPGDHAYYVEIDVDTGAAECTGVASIAQPYVSMRAPVAPALAAPEDGATVNGDVDLTWDAVPGASTYDVEVDGALACASVATGSCTVTSLGDGEHTWRVAAKNLCGWTPSAMRSFTVAR